MDKVKSKNSRSRVDKSNNHILFPGYGLILIRWFGGKFKFRKWIYNHFPTEFNSYIEPFGGSGAILLNKVPSTLEVYNDLDGGLVNLFRVMQDPVKKDLLESRLAWTLYSREELIKAVDIIVNRSWKDDVEWAWAFFTAVNQGFSAKHPEKSGKSWSFSVKGDKRVSKKSGVVSYQPASWFSKIDDLNLIHERLRYVQIESRDAIDCILHYDHKDAFFYIDPPYLFSTRDSKDENYAVELDESYHSRLLDVLLKVRGKVLISGYPSPMYDRLVQNGWSYDELNVCLSSAYYNSAKRLLAKQGKDVDIDEVIEKRKYKTEALWANYPFNLTTKAKETIDDLDDGDDSESNTEEKEVTDSKKNFVFGFD